MVQSSQVQELELLLRLRPSQSLQWNRSLQRANQRFVQRQESAATIKKERKLFSL